MSVVNNCAFKINKIAIIGNYYPRKCGIATFTTDLLSSILKKEHGIECLAIVMNDKKGGYHYPEEVRFELDSYTLKDYHVAADFINKNDFDIVCVQHEYGIFGGDYGSYIIELLNNLKVPIVTTLHTILKYPNLQQLRILKKISELSDRLIVMSYRAIDILKGIYDVQPDKIVMIPHGIPDVPFIDPNYYKDRLNVEGKKVIMTFGLISPNKGIEYMIEALPNVIEKHSDVVYIVLGETHPHIKRDYGESYRLMLQRRSIDLGIEKHVIFYDKFVDTSKLCEFLGSADIYVTPYLNKEQIISGTLAYALGTGKATISTPYWYAEEMLAEGRGLLVSFGDSLSLATAINYLLDNEKERHLMRKRAYEFCREMIWEKVALEYLEVFEDVKIEKERKPRMVYKTKTIEEEIFFEIPKLKLDHLIRMTDDVGILQHAKYIVPDRHHGYCTDDNSRALIVTLMAHKVMPYEDKLYDYICKYLSFLYYAFNEKYGRFRNFLRYDRRWLEDIGSQDSHGRALYSLGKTIALSKSDDIMSVALYLFERALHSVSNFDSPRAWSFSIIGVYEYLKRFSGDRKVKRIAERILSMLLDLYRRNADINWPWIEEKITYANGVIPHALIVGGDILDRDDILYTGLSSLEWLINIQIEKGEYFVPVGNKGWYARGKEKARFDQQPLEAVSIIEACQVAYYYTNDIKWLTYAQKCFEWFLGKNDLNMPLYDFETGGCCDGLTPKGPNMNQGAESTLAWLLSLLTIYQMKNEEIVVEPDLRTDIDVNRGCSYECFDNEGTIS